MPSASAPILLDFETRSRAELKSIGGRRYSQDPSTEVLCCAWYDTASGERGVWLGHDDWPHHGRRLGAHNAMGFDRHIADALGWECPAVDWVDTSELARRAGLPGALDALATRWLGLEKDKEASRFTTGLSSVRRPSGKGPGAIPPDVWRELSSDAKRTLGTLPDLTPDVMARVVPYCISDVDILQHGWPLLESWADLEPDVQRVDRIVNDRGIYFDDELAVALLECDQRNAEQVCADVGRELGWSASRVASTANSPAQFCIVTGAPNAQKDTVEAMTHPLARARQALASIASGKLEAGLARCSDDFRLRDMLRYYAAHTGRWGGKGLQPQNLPRPHKRYEEWSAEQIDELATAVSAGKHFASQDEIDLLVRATLTAMPGYGLAVCDFSGVEARALAWCAGDRGALRVFREGKRDPYKVAASVIFGVPYEQVDKAMRQVGKIAELACGYGMGSGKFEMTALKMGGVVLSDIGVDADEVVKAWRQLHAPIVKFWRSCEDAFVQTLQGHSTRVDCFEFTCSDDGRDVAVFLPSGRPIVYNNAQISWQTDKWGREKPSPSFHGTKGREHTYGGKITENLIQALCRDLMADALVRSEAAGLRPVLHVHDEIVCEVPLGALEDGYHELHEITTTLPDWAAGFPIGAAGFHGKRYRK